MKAIIFDFDGVIHDTFELAYKIFFGMIGESFTRDKFRDFFNGNVFEGAKINEEERKTFFDLQNEAFKYLKIDKDIKENLLKLAEKYTLFIISSNHEKALNIYFQNNKFVDIFKEILGEETNRSKVKKFKHIFKKYDLEPNDCIFVTDTLGDILEGKKAGIRTIAVDFGFHGRKTLEKGEPFKIVSSFEEILEVIAEL